MPDDDPEFSVGKPRDLKLFLAESGGNEQRVVGASPESHLHHFGADPHGRRGTHEAVEQLLCLDPFVLVADSSSQQAVQCGRHHGELQVGIDLQRHRRRERVHVEELDGLGDGVLDDHATGVAVAEGSGRCSGLVGQQQGRILVSQVGHRDLAERAGVVA